MFKPLSWGEIEVRAAKFAEEWQMKQKHVEEQDAQTFESDFFHVFGVNQKQVAEFESKVKIEGKKGIGSIDLLWAGKILIEMKSTGKDLNEAFRQAFEYYENLDTDKKTEIILVSDFARFDYYDMTNHGEKTSFSLKDFPKHIRLFESIAGYRKTEHMEESPVNIKAAENMGKLHDALKAAGYTGHQLEVYLVRLLFCLFADDTGIFNDNQFYDYIELRTAEDGHDLGEAVNSVFSVLNKPEEKRMSSMDELLKGFPYINGGLFAEPLETAYFDSRMRDTLLRCAEFDWAEISPEIFGAMFQSVMNQDERHDLGAHYTSRENILKVIEPLFLNSLKQELARICQLKNLRDRKDLLMKFQDKLASLTFFDPACGCGNFLVVTYREIRKLELQTLIELYRDDDQQFLDISHICKVRIDQFYGIEILDFPAQVAHVSLWLTDHLCNKEVGRKFGQVFKRIPLTKFENIHCCNSLTTDWNTVIPADRMCYIISNPPFLGARIMGKEQKQDVESLFTGTKNPGNLDYVCCWYKKAAEMMNIRPEIKTALVSTNSITQGEQVAILWKPLFERNHIHIDFAYRTFRWDNKARAKAKVHCVIIGFSCGEARGTKVICDESGRPEIAQNINPYLVDAPDMFIDSRTKPLCSVPEIGIGNKPIDGGNYLFTAEERAAFLQLEPSAEPFFKPWYGADEFINGHPRYCLWLGDCSPADLRKMPECLKRVQAVREFRLASKSPGTVKLAERPTRFHVENMPSGTYVVIPKVSSERRFYMPVGFLSPQELASDLIFLVPNATLYHFGVLTSIVHMAWMRAVCGRLEMRYRYSKDVVYNNFPWCEPTDEQKEAIEKTAQGILDARAQYPNCSLADLYDETAMPPELRKAHTANDYAVLRAYGLKTDISEKAIVEYLFRKYSELAKRS
ncbi:MAG: class I SAM-dependent DNA methyltransferase [Lentisphaeria bacterium]|nr:class I SAM-dependent DNA methyltransferase [Lentisphaeria bacterium]